jgi:hypothetical protein
LIPGDAAVPDEASRERGNPGGGEPKRQIFGVLGSRTVSLLLVVGVSVLAGLWVWRLTEHGIGVGSDSAVYISGARNILEGNGFVWFGGDRLTTHQSLSTSHLSPYPPAWRWGFRLRTRRGC